GVEVLELHHVVARDDLCCVRQRALAFAVSPHLHLDDGERILDDPRLMNLFPEADRPTGCEYDLPASVLPGSLMSVSEIVGKGVRRPDRAHRAHALQLVQDLFRSLLLQRLAKLPPLSVR